MVYTCSILVDTDKHFSKVIVLTSQQWMRVKIVQYLCKILVFLILTILVVYSSVTSWF